MSVSALDAKATTLPSCKSALPRPQLEQRFPCQDQNTSVRPRGRSIAWFSEKLHCVRETSENQRFFSKFLKGSGIADRFGMKGAM